MHCDVLQPHALARCSGVALGMNSATGHQQERKTHNIVHVPAVHRSEWSGKGHYNVFARVLLFYFF